MKLQIGEWVLSLYETVYQEVLIDSNRIKITDLKGKLKKITFTNPRENKPEDGSKYQKRSNEGAENLPKVGKDSLSPASASTDPSKKEPPRQKLKDIIEDLKAQIDILKKETSDTTKLQKITEKTDSYDLRILDLTNTNNLTWNSLLDYKEEVRKVCHSIVDAHNELCTDVERMDRTLAQILGKKYNYGESQKGTHKIIFKKG